MGPSDNTHEQAESVIRAAVAAMEAHDPKLAADLALKAMFQSAHAAHHMLEDGRGDDPTTREALRRVVVAARLLTRALAIETPTYLPAPSPSLSTHDCLQAVVDSWHRWTDGETDRQGFAQEMHAAVGALERMVGSDL